ncbi:MAG TPA: helix-turn-helix domain-containing protein [Candidatus Baltobacteraceae bacterium]|nr:helix-turn-helix domain-containing protein [Candidatus Baltobacteraceae bacterium]
MTADELVAFAEELARIAAAGGGAKALADLLARRGRVGVLVEDAEWRHVAAAGDSGLPSSVRPLLDAGTSDRFYAALANGRGGRTMAIAAGEKRLGQISIFGESDLDSLEHLVRLTAGAIGVELAREQAGTPGRRRAFWERLATLAYVDASAARDDASARGITLATHYVAIALEPETSDAQTAAADQSALREAAMQTFRGGDADAGLWERGATLFFFVPAAREIDRANARTAASLLAKSLAKKHQHLRVGGGVGGRVPFFDLHYSIAQAGAALTISRRLYGSGRIGIHEELGAYPLLLSGADAPVLREFAARTLAPLRAYDEKHQTELEKTLRVYFSAGENVKTASEQLNVHRHTVFYRLRQIGEICSCKLDDPHDQLTLRMAMAIDALTN